MPAKGKHLESEIRDALTAAGAWHHNFENTGQVRRGDHANKAQRPADKVACIDGPLLLIECKENASKAALDFDELKFHQEANLYSVASCRGEAIVATSYKEKRLWRTFLVWYTDWAHLKRNKTRSSIPLCDSSRPGCFIELKKIDTDHSGRVLDVVSGIKALRSLDAAPLYHLSPKQERRGF